MKGDREKRSPFVDTEQIVPVALPCHSTSMEVSGHPCEGGKRHCVLDLCGTAGVAVAFSHSFYSH